jgi:hypothetical protein
VTAILLIINKTSACSGLLGRSGLFTLTNFSGSGLTNSLPLIVVACINLNVLDPSLPNSPIP